ncbi:UDP-glucuronic acid decarboxylase family protein [Pollutimonas sp. H1-120]|uniref:UDP-glucuronic acid decarboxylase family protein n=1 Tax=Pollutimonas sp. H1-120 TaxID=3148824 RepID=UPI003B529C2D
MSNAHGAKECILVAGGAGFIGASLCRRLLRQGHAVICLDSFLTGDSRNIAPLRDNPRFTLIRHDVIEPIPTDIFPTQIYNLACPASPPHYQADPIHTLRSCVDGAYNLLELARRTGARILQASTSEVYGDPSVNPQPEAYRGNVNMVGPRSCYDEGKRCAETLFSDYGKRKQVTVKIARIFNTYGPFMSRNDGRLVSNLVLQALTGRKLTIYGDGSQTRSLCYVDDLIEGLVRLMASEDGLSSPVNLGNPDENTVLDIAKAVRRLTSSRSVFEFLPLPIDDPLQRCPDITLARRFLRWNPSVDMDTGLRRTVEYFRRTQPGLEPSGIVPAGYKASWG